MVALLETLELWDLYTVDENFARKVRDCYDVANKDLTHVKVDQGTIYVVKSLRDKSMAKALCSWTESIKYVLVGSKGSGAEGRTIYRERNVVQE